MHAQMNWLDALGGGSLLQSYKSFMEELGFKNFSKRRASDPVFLGIAGLITIASLILITLISKWLFISVISLIALTGLLALISKSAFVSLLSKLKLFNAYGYNAKKHLDQMTWLNKNYGKDIWCATFSEAAEYFDLRKNVVIGSKENELEIKNKGSFKWDGRIINLSFRVNEPITSYTVISEKSKYHSKIDDVRTTVEGVILKNIPINPLDKKTIVKLKR